MLGKKGRGWEPFVGLQPMFLSIFVKTWSNHNFETGSQTDLREKII